MARPSAIVTEAELSVLNHLWQHGPSVVREIARAVYADNTPAYHATVNSLLDQLEQKGYVSRDRSSFAHGFTAKIDRSELVGSQLQQLADSHFDGVLTPMLLSLVEKIKLSRRDRDAIRKIIDRVQ